MPQPPVMRSRGEPPRLGRSLTPTEWTAEIAPRDLSYIVIDHQTRLQFNDIQVAIGTEFELQLDGQSVFLDPEDRAALGPLLALYPTSLADSHSGPDGTLRLVFTCGSSIDVPPHPMYEPWQITGPGDTFVVCGPGVPARLAIWP